VVDHAPSLDASLPQAARRPLPLTESAGARAALIAAALGFLLLFLLLPLIVVFAEALRLGLGSYWKAIREPEALAAIRLTLLTALTVVPLNAIFGIAAAWAIAKFQFAGKNLLITLVDLPFSVSPVIGGMVFVLLFGLQGVFGPWLAAHDIKIIFAIPRGNHRDAVRDASLRRPRADPADAEAGHRLRGGRADAWCERLADPVPRHTAQHQMGPALRSATVQRARYWRVRCGRRRIGTHCRAHHHHAVVHRSAL
jgi:hypothetical protein